MNILVPVLIAGIIGYGGFMVRYAFKHPETASTLPEDIPLEGTVIDPPTAPTTLLPQAKQRKMVKLLKDAGKKPSRKFKKGVKK